MDYLNQTRFLELNSGLKEPEIRSSLMTILRDTDPEGSWEPELNLAGKRSDICSIPSKTIIEVKGKTKIKQAKNKEQLLGYAREFDEKYGGTQFGCELKIPCRCILTDGKYWASWDYDNSENILRDRIKLKQLKSKVEISKFIDDEILYRWKGHNRIKIPSKENLVDNDFRARFEELKQLLNEGIDAEKGFDTKFKLWKKTLQGTGIIPEQSLRKQQDLFLRHSFIVITARLIIAYIENTSPLYYQDSISNGFFAWVIETTKGKKIVESLYNDITGYYWQFTGTDVLKHLYHSLIDASQRKEFGEFYTPDELAKNLVLEVLDEDWLDDAIVRANDLIENRSIHNENLGVLDPSCGSGTFLFYSSKKILERIKQKYKLLIHKSGEIVAKLVHGIDVHPVAVEMSKATLRMSIPSNEHFQFRICLGSSMQENINKTATILGMRLPTAKDGHEISLGNELHKHPQIDTIIDNVISSINENIEPNSHEKYDGICKLEYDEFCKTMKETIQEQGNHVWGTYIINQIRIREMFSKGVGRLVGNPPWQVRNNAEENNRKKLISALAKEEGVYTRTKGYLANVDLAKVLSARSIRLYLGTTNMTNKYGWVLPNSPIISQAWDKWRKGFWSYKGSDTPTYVNHSSIWNLTHCTPPLFLHSPNGCSVVIGRRLDKKSNESAEILEYRGDYFSGHTKVSKKGLLESIESYYFKHVERGTFFGPFCYYQVIRRDPIPNSKLCFIVTHKGTKNQWKNKGLEGEIENDSLLPLIDSKHLKDLNYHTRMWLIAPLNASGELMLNHTSDLAEMRRKKFPMLHEYWNRCQREYNALRNPKNSKPHLEKNYGYNIDLKDELTRSWNEANHDKTKATALPPPGERQSWDLEVFRHGVESNRKRKVVYNSSGNILRAVRIPLNVVANSKLYYLLCQTEREAQYLVGVISAPDMQPIWRATKTSKMHYHMSPFKKIPVPRFDSNDPLHVEIARVIGCLEQRNSYSPNFNILNPLVRKLMKDTFEQIAQFEHYLFA